MAATLTDHVEALRQRLYEQHGDRLDGITLQLLDNIDADIADVRATLAAAVAGVTNLKAEPTR